MSFRSPIVHARFCSSNPKAIVGSLGAGAGTNVNSSGWWYIFWMQAAFLGTTSPAPLLLATKERQIFSHDRLGMCLGLRPIGSRIFIAGATLMLLALDWAGSTHAWSDIHVASTLSVGLILLTIFSLYGKCIFVHLSLIADWYIRQNASFTLFIFAFAVEGWTLCGAVNSIVPQLVLNLEFQTNSWLISIRQLSDTFTTMVASIPITWNATHFRDLKSPLILTSVVFFVVTICYANIRPSWNSPQIGFSISAASANLAP